MKKRWIFLIIIFILLLALFLIRLINPRQLDDVSPLRGCSEELLEKADTFWIIPYFDNQSIADDNRWCDYILSLNKTLELHGVTHEYDEFHSTRSQEYLQQGISIFEDCFNKTPTQFKPPRLKINKQNKYLLKQNNLKIKSKFNQLTHKVYHCSDVGMFPNKFIEIF